MRRTPPSRAAANVENTIEGREHRGVVVEVEVRDHRRAVDRAPRRVRAVVLGSFPAALLVGLEVPDGDRSLAVRVVEDIRRHAVRSAATVRVAVAVARAVIVARAWAEVDHAHRVRAALRARTTNAFARHAGFAHGRRVTEAGVHRGAIGVGHTHRVDAPSGRTVAVGVAARARAVAPAHPPERDQQGAPPACRDSHLHTIPPLIGGATPRAAAAARAGASSRPRAPRSPARRRARR